MGTGMVVEDDEGDERGAAKASSPADGDGSIAKYIAIEPADNSR